MGSHLHRCPQCRTIGKVNRSKTRTLGEKIRMRLVPMYAIYRCHNCNWRGWLLRSTYSPVVNRLLLAGYILIMALAIAAVVGAAIHYWPSAKYKY